MENLSYEVLIETYLKAKELGLAEVFITMIKEEIDKRGITEQEIEHFKKLYYKT